VSWDVLLLRVPDGITELSDIPDDFQPPPLGPLPQVLDTLCAVIPDIDLSDPTWGEATGPTWSIEFSIGAQDPVTSIMLLVRGSGEDVLPVIGRLSAALGCRPIDSSGGDFLRVDDPGSWRDYQAYRDQVMGPRSPS
jgi:hypothetical protein